MKSKELHTIYDVVVRNYTIAKLSDVTGKYLHTFSPLTTSTVYQFEANGVAVMKDGEHYNIGFTPDPTGLNVIDVSALSLTSQVNPTLSYLAAKNYAKERHAEEKDKNDRRVSHTATDGYYWGKKYAWRMYGAFMAEDAFIAYFIRSGTSLYHASRLTQIFQAPTAAQPHMPK